MSQRKLQANITDEHRCKNPQQNTSKVWPLNAIFFLILGDFFKIPEIFPIYAMWLFQYSIDLFNNMYILYTIIIISTVVTLERALCLVMNQMSNTHVL